MRRPWFLASILLVIPSLLLTGCQPAEQEEESPGEEAAMEEEKNPEEAIRERLKQFETSWSNGDAQAIAQAFTPEGDLVGPDGRMARGRQEIEQRYSELFSGIFKGTDVSVTADSIRFLEPDVAVVSGSYEITGVEATGDEAPPTKGKFMTVVIRQDGQWLTVASRPMVPVKAPGTTQSGSEPKSRSGGKS